MELLLLQEPLTFFQVSSLETIDFQISPLNVSVTAEEISVVAPNYTRTSQYFKQRRRMANV